MKKEQVEEKLSGEKAKNTPKQPCEVALWHILPCIRACLARELVEMDLTQQRVADILGITQAAVSQYIGEKRGKFRTENNNVYRSIKELARDLERDEVADISARICQICSQVQENPQLLRLCGVPDNKANRINIC
ncbi:MAG: transcriptional regulator [Candidatus Bipolaricaulia bacterium]